MRCDGVLYKGSLSLEFVADFDTRVAGSAVGKDGPDLGKSMGVFIKDNWPVILDELGEGMSGIGKCKGEEEGKPCTLCRHGRPLSNHLAHP